VQRGSNQTSSSGYNQTLVLDLIRRSVDGLSRVELAEGTGLSAQTITNVTRRLVDETFIREAGVRIDGPGKPRTTLRLEPGARYAVGVHLDPSFVTVVILDLEGTVIAHSRGVARAGAHPEDTIDLLASSVRSMIEAAGIDLSKVLGIGVAAPGPLDAIRGTLIDPPLLAEWHDVPLRSALSLATGLPVLLEKDATAAAVAERWIAREHARENFLFFYYGTGVGSGLVVDNTVVRGAGGNAGDVAHVIVEEGGVLCWCGSRGCLGDGIIPARLVAEARAPGLRQTQRVLAAPADIDVAFTAFAEAVSSAEPGAVATLGAAARRISRALVILINLLDVRTIVFGGPFWDRIAPTLLATVPALTRDDPALVGGRQIEFVGSSLGDDVAAIGAACLVLDNTFSPRPAALLIAGE
jgi:predicted NBD/HSP70 family sugar kinase